mgnify:FL=1|tara:strand:- start:746 stop:1018 length:273 start_codon:yes stop_codon:yes gene_type:complete
MVTSQTSSQLTIAQKIAKGSRIEVYFNPDIGLDIDVDGETILTAREFHMVLTSSDGQAQIRCHEKHGDIDEWHDIFVPNIIVYTAISRKK